MTMSAIEASIIVAHPEVCSTFVRWCFMFPDTSIQNLDWVFEHRHTLDVWMDTPAAAELSERALMPWLITHAVEVYEEDPELVCRTCHGASFNECPDCNMGRVSGA